MDCTSYITLLESRMSKARKKQTKASHSCRCYEELLLQPWFLSTRVARGIRSLLPPDFRSRLHDYFNDHGCLRCGRRNVLYRSNGMCHRCMSIIIGRLEGCAYRRSKTRLSRKYGASFASEISLAHRLLATLRKPKKKRSGSNQVKYFRVANPVLGPG
jgi:hypothetical protein